MKQSYRHFLNRRGASTLEYVIILVAAMILATLLYNMVSGDEVKGKILTAIENAINGKSSGETNEPHKDKASPTKKPDKKKKAYSKKSNPSWENRLKQKYKKYEEYIKCSRAFRGDIVSYWTCLNQDDIDKDIKDFTEDPKGYINDVLGLDDLKESVNKLANVNYKEQLKQVWNNPGGYLKRKGDFLKQKWKAFNQDPMGHASTFVAEISGWNDAIAWWTGIDPQTGEKLRIPNRLFRLGTAIPFYTKAGKVASKATDRDVLDFLHDFACAKGKNSCSKPDLKTHSSNDTNFDYDPNKVKKQLDPEMGKVSEVTKTYKRDTKKYKTGDEVLKRRKIVNWEGKKKSIFNGDKDKVDIQTEDGKKFSVPFKNGFPNFDKWSAIELKLPEETWFKSDVVQFRALNRKVYQRAQSDPNLKEQFTDEELEKLKNGENINRFTWHHHQQPGKMQLVLRDVHGQVRHTGGREIWGGGEERRTGKLDPS